MPYPDAEIRSLPFSSSELDATGSYMATKHAIRTVARHQDKVHV